MSNRRGYDLPSRHLVAQADQSMIQRPDIPRSKFTGSWTRKMTFDAGGLYPFLVEEVLPGDHLTYKAHAYVRTETPLFPIMDSQRIDTFFFFVPCRLVWANWQRFMGEQPTGPSDSIAFEVPVLESGVGGFVTGGCADHMGIPTIGQTDPSEVIQVNALPFRAYRLIYNQWFRDENLITTSPPSTGNGPDAVSAYPIFQRAKSHDYFTSCLPWPQKFDSPTVPFSGQAPVVGLGFTGAGSTATGSLNVTETPGDLATYSFWRTADANVAFEYDAADPTGVPQVFADLEAATGVGMAINTFRQAFLVQQLLERDARGGTRYTEIVKSHFGVSSPDARLQRAEYIGGGSTALEFTPIAQTAPTTTPLGSLGATGTGFGQHRANYAATEHGYIIGIINVKSELSYYQGIHKMWDRRTRLDFYFPSLAGLGEQAVLRRELYATGVSADDQTVFGYQERWHEYRTRVSEVTGNFRPNASVNLEQWHLAQEFASPPTLGQTFIQDTPPMDRVLAAGATAAGFQYKADIVIERTAVRPLPAYGTPVLLGRF